MQLLYHTGRGKSFVLFLPVTFFADNVLLTVYLECGNELPVVKYKDLLAKVLWDKKCNF